MYRTDIATLTDTQTGEVLRTFHFQAHLTPNGNRLRLSSGPVMTHLCKHTLMRDDHLSPWLAANAIMRPGLALIGS